MLAMRCNLCKVQDAGCMMQDAKMQDASEPHICIGLYLYKANGTGQDRTGQDRQTDG